MQVNPELHIRRSGVGELIQADIENPVIQRAFPRMRLHRLTLDPEQDGDRAILVNKPGNPA